MKNSYKKAAASVVATKSPTRHARDGGQTQNRLIPVRRKKRADWVIPRTHEQQLRQAEKDDLVYAQELCRGTSPQGRAIYSKTCCGITNQLRRAGTRFEEVVAYAQSEFRTFPSLEREFKQLFMIGRSKDPERESLTLDQIATILAIREKARLALFGPPIVAAGWLRPPRDW
jgi:hypothetical protein